MAIMARLGEDISQGGSAETLFFVHIPKCAGSSFRQVLNRWFGKDALFLDTHDPGALEQALAARPAPPRAIAGHMPFALHEALAAPSCLVSLVRHPLDRFVSVWRHARRTPADPLHEAAARLDLGAFYDFTLGDERAFRRTVAVQCQFLGGARSFEAAREAIDRRYFLAAPVERYEAFVQACALRFGRPAAIPPARNVSPDAPIPEDIRTRLLPRIAADHCEDVGVYRYVCETFEDRLVSLGGVAGA